MAVTAVAAIVAAAIGAGTAIYGASQKKKAERLAKQNIRPTYETPQAELDILSQLEGMAGTGLSDSSKRLYTQNADRGLSSSIEAILKGGGDVNNINKSYQGYTDSLTALALADDQAKLRNVNSYIEQQRRVAGYQDKAFSLNEYAPYADTAARAAQERAQGERNLISGIGQVGGAVTTLAGGLKRQSDINSINGTGTGVGDTPVSNNGTSFSLKGSYLNEQSPNYGYLNNTFSGLKPSDRMTLARLLYNDQSAYNVGY